MSAAMLADWHGGEWIEHPEYAGYFFARDGRCASVRKGRMRILVGCASGLGYRAVSCPDGAGGYKRLYIHRAVCDLFNGPPSADKYHCRHLDGDMFNNAASNLEWGTPTENMQDMRRHGRTGVGERNVSAKLTVADVEKMRLERQATGVSYKAIARQFGVSTMTAFRAITGESWK